MLWTPYQDVPVRSLPGLSGSLNSNNGNENGKKSNRFRLAKQQRWTYITRFCTFLCRRCTIRTQNCIILHFVEDVNTQDNDFLIYFWISKIQSFRIQAQKKLVNIWQIGRPGSWAMNFEKWWIHLLRDPVANVFVVLVASRGSFLLSCVLAQDTIMVPHFTHWPF